MPLAIFLVLDDVKDSRIGLPQMGSEELLLSFHGHGGLGPSSGYDRPGKATKGSRGASQTGQRHGELSEDGST